MKKIVYFKYLTWMVLCLFVLRLYYLQIHRHTYFKDLVFSNTHIKKINKGLRGNIEDRNGVILARTVNMFKLVFSGDPKDIEHIKNRLSWIKAKRKIEADKIKFENVSWEDLQTILTLYDIPSPEIDVSQVRQYSSPANSSITGYIKDFENNIQKTGLEKNMSEKLEGKSGVILKKIDAKRRVLSDAIISEPKPGSSIKLSIDSRLQDYAYKILSEHIKASLIIIDVETGEVLCAVSYPGYDANDFANTNTHKISEYMKDVRNPLFNNLFNGVYNIGSTVKPFMMLSVLLSHKICNLPKMYFCNCHYVYGDRVFKCLHNHGFIPIDKILSYSCNVAFYELVNYNSLTNIQKIWNVFGLDEPVLVDFTKAYSTINVNNWKKLDTMFMHIGQGHARATLPQLVRAYARLATWKKVELTLFKTDKKVNFESLSIDSIPIPEENLRFVRNSLFFAVNDPHGTAYFGRFINLAGKTGTVQNYDTNEDMYGRFIMEKDWSKRDHRLFCGFGPCIVSSGSAGSSSSAKIAGCIIIEHGISSRVAAKALIQIMKVALLDLYGIDILQPAENGYIIKDTQ